MTSREALIGALLEVAERLSDADQPKDASICREAALVLHVSAQPIRDFSNGQVFINPPDQGQ